MAKVKTAIIGSGNIGTDLMMKISEMSDVLEVGCVIGIDEASEGLAKARERGYATSHTGIEGAQELDVWGDIKIVFDATSAYVHKKHSDICTAARHAGIITKADGGVGVATGLPGLDSYAEGEANGIKGRHAREPVTQCTGDGQTEVNIPKRLGRFGNTGSQFRVF